MRTNLIVVKSRVAFFAVLLLFVLYSNHAAFGQWQNVGQFSSDVGQPVSFQALYGDSIILVGFAGGGVWRTTNAGTTWQKTIPTFVWVSDFAFKNDSEGWISNETGYDGPVLCHTTDAGLTWNSVTTTPAGNGFYGEEVGVIYQSSSDVLWLLSWDTSNSMLRSTDEGKTWSTYGPKPQFNSLWYGMAFSNDTHAIYGFPIDGVTPRIFVTNDNWNTWQTLPYPNDGEVWQPLAIPGTDTIISISEWMGYETYSTDGGYTWIWLPPDTTLWMTGAPTWCNCGSAVLSQEVYLPFFKQGVLYTTDLGSSWTSIGGPSNFNDTRIFYSGNYIYAGSDIGDSSYSVWRYAVHHYPTITSPGPLLSCSGLDTSIHISFTNTCFGISASLDSATLTGSQAFTLQPLTFPYALQNEQDLALHYAGSPGAHDTAWLHLYFNQHGDRKDTILPLIGYAPQPDSLQLVLTPSDTATAGQIVTCYAVLSGTLPTALISLHFTIAHNDDLLGFQQAAGMSVTRGPQNHGIETDTFVWLPSGTPTDTIGTITFEAFLTDSSSTPLTLSNIQFTNQLALVPDCLASIQDSSASFTYLFTCGEPTMQDALKGLPFTIQSIVPNPASTEITVAGTGLTGVSVELYDLLGQTAPLVRPSPLLETEGEFDLNVSSLPSGTYYLRLSAGGEVQTRRVVIER